MRAELVPNEDPGRTSRLLLVWSERGEAAGRPAVVWWDLSRPLPWRCSVHGRQDRLECAHVRAAAKVLARSLFSVHGRPAPTPRGGPDVVR